VAATGTVLLQGSPVEGANVAFVPQDAATGRVAVGRTDAQGRFQLATSQQASGALPGSYKVKISKEVSEGGMSAEESQAYFQKTGQPPPPATVKDLLPAKYKNADSSGLTAEVKSGSNDFKFELTP
jgi:hypothetical protein